MAMVEKWKWIHDKGDSCGALLTGYIETFDCIADQFLIDILEYAILHMKCLTLETTFR